MLISIDTYLSLMITLTCLKCIIGISTNNNDYIRFRVTGSKRFLPEDLSDQNLPACNFSFMRVSNRSGRLSRVANACCASVPLLQGLYPPGGALRTRKKGGESCM